MLTNGVPLTVVSQIMEQQREPQRLEAVTTWVSQAGFDAERHTPGSADAVVWADVTQRAYEESELDWTYLAS